MNLQELIQKLKDRFDELYALNNNVVMTVRVKIAGLGQFMININGSVPEILDGADGTAGLTFTVDSEETANAIATGKLDVMTAWRAGQIDVDGDENFVKPALAAFKLLPKEKPEQGEKPEESDKEAAGQEGQPQTGRFEDVITEYDQEQGQLSPGETEDDAALDQVAISQELESALGNLNKCLDPDASAKKGFQIALNLTIAVDDDRAITKTIIITDETCAVTGTGGTSEDTPITVNMAMGWTTLLAIVNGERDVSQALEDGTIQATGNLSLIDGFCEVFDLRKAASVADALVQKTDEKTGPDEVVKDEAPGGADSAGDETERIPGTANLPDQGGAVLTAPELVPDPETGVSTQGG